MAKHGEDPSGLEEYGIFLADAPPELLAKATMAATPWVSMLTRLGIAALFIINGLTAIIKPAEFLALVQNNLILGVLPDGLHEIVVRSAAIPDLGIAALLVSRRNDAMTALAMGLWMGSIALVKGMNLILG